MNAPLNALTEMQRLTSPFAESITVQQWKAKNRKVIGWIYPYLPEEIIHAGGMLPFKIGGDNQPVDMQATEAQIWANTCSFARTSWQLALDGRFDFLDGLVVATQCDQDKRLFDVWKRYKTLPYMDMLYAPHKRDEPAVKLYQADLEDFRDRLSNFRTRRIIDRDISRSIDIYNHGRALMAQLYELRKRDRPPVSGAEAMEISKLATRLPREQFNELLEQLLDEIERSGREIRKSRRLMILGNDIYNTNQIAALEALDAVVVVDEFNCGVRYAWGQVATNLPPLEALARYYVLTPPAAMHHWDSTQRLALIGKLADEYRVDGAVSGILRYCTYNGWDKMDVKKLMEARNIPLLEIDMEYGHPSGAQVRVRAEAFMEMVEDRAL